MVYRNMRSMGLEINDLIAPTSFDIAPEHMFETTLTVTIFADSEEQLDEYMETLVTEYKKASVVIETMTDQQEEGFNSTLPLCYNQVACKRTLKSSSAAIFYYFNKTEELLAIAKSMRTPVFLSEQEFNLISGISKSGEAILVEDYANRFETLKDGLKKAKSILKKEPVHKNALEYQEVGGYVHLPKDVIRTLEQMEIADLTIVNRDISFPKSKQQEMDGILEALLYLDMKPLERREAEMSSEEKKTIIEYRTYDNVDNEAHCALRFAESLEKRDLHMDNPDK